MNANPMLKSHLNTCDEVFNLVSEENRVLKVEHRIPDSRLLEKKKSLLERLDHGLDALRVWEVDQDSPRPERQLVERLRSRILQILHLDRENEQLLLRYSLSSMKAPRMQSPKPQQLRGLYQ